MTSLGPYREATNYTHMFDFVNMVGTPTPFTGCSGSILNELSKDPDTQGFYKLIQKARMEKILNQPQADFTLFVPLDSDNKELDLSYYDNIDISDAQNLLKSAMLPRRITKDILINSPCLEYITKAPPKKLLITNISGKTMIDNNSQIVFFDIQCDNGVYHKITNIIKVIPH